MSPARREIIQPPDEVLAAFGADGPAVRLDGGQGQAWRAGDIVLKPARDDARTLWLAEFQESFESERVRVPRPARAADGRFVCEGWQAWERVPGEHRADAHAADLDLCVDFHRAVAATPRPAWVDDPDPGDPWVVADRAAWGEIDYELHARVAPLAERLRRRVRDTGEPAQLIHADFGGNILWHDELPPAIIDLSPAWRPAGFAAGVVVADAVVWGGADASLIDAGDSIPHFARHLARAELRRILEIDALHRLYGWDMLGELDAHLPLIGIIENL